MLECETLAFVADPTYFEIWAKYEDIAMHFNGLIIQFRIQAVGGLAALATVGGLLLDKVEDRRTRFGAVALVSAVFAVAWSGIAALDLFYYSKLLKGAVAAIRRLERVYKPVPKVDLSTSIESHVGWGEHAPWFFYGSILLLLGATAVWSRWKYRGLAGAHGHTAESRTTRSAEPASHESAVS